MAKRHHSNRHQIVRYEFSGELHWQLLYGYLTCLNTDSAPAESHMERNAIEQVGQRTLSAQLTIWYTTSQREQLDHFIEKTLHEYLSALRIQGSINPTSIPIKIRSRKKVDSID